MPLGFLAIVIASLDLLLGGDLGKPVGPGQLGCSTEVNRLGFPFVIVRSTDVFWEGEAISLSAQ